MAKYFKYAFVKPVQDLAGVQTWVSKNRQDGVQNDTTAPEKSRADYQDGKPQRDRVLPLPSGHPKGRDEKREGFGGFFTPPDSSNAVGKPLHQKPRSSGLPGEEYGHPYVDGKNTTGIARRTMTSSEYFGDEIDFNDRLAIPRADISLKAPGGERPRQREQKGQLKRKRHLEYRRLKRRNRSVQKNLARRWYLRNKTRVKRRMELYRGRLKRHKRLTGGGVSTQQQKNNRSEARRKKAFMKREAIRNVLSTMYRQVDADYVNTFDFTNPAEHMGEELLAVPKIGPGSRSTRQQVKQRALRRKRNPADRKRQKRLNRLYYRRNKNKIKRITTKWRRKNKSKIKRWDKTRARFASSYFKMVRSLPCIVDGRYFLVESLSPCTGYALMRDREDQWALPLREFYYSADWQSEADEFEFDDFIGSVASSFKVASGNEPTNPKLWGKVIDLARGDSDKELCVGDECISPVRGGEGFQKYPSAYANGWASAQYKRLGGGWRKKAGVSSLSALQILLAALRGAHWAHLTSHWQVKGESYYGDHQLMERIYGSLTDEIDTLAEKIVSMFGPEGVEPVSQAQIMANTLLPMAEMHSQHDPIKRALLVEEALQLVFKKVYALLKNQGSLSLGMDDFIMSMANNHETNLYLLRQRTR